MDETKSDGSWWRTVPGILTAAAGTLTAITGLTVALQQTGLPGVGDKSRQQSNNESRVALPASTATQPKNPQAPSPAVVEASAPAKPDSAPRPWAESEAVITSIDGVVTVVNAESLSNCISTNKELTLSSGQSIAFEKMRAV